MTCLPTPRRCHLQVRYMKLRPAIDGQLEFDGDVDLGKSEQRNRPSPVEPQDPRRAVLVALSWSIPLAMLAGAALTYLFLTYL